MLPPAVPGTLAAILALSLISCDRNGDELSRPPEASRPPGVTTSPATAPVGTAPSQTSAAVASSSPNFSQVTSRLDMGGKSLEFQDHEGQREMLVEIIQGLFKSIPEIQASTGHIDPGALIDASGLSTSIASGRSVRKDGDSWLMRSYSYNPGGVKGLPTLLGNESFPFTSPRWIPASTDLVVETRINATVVPGLFQQIGKACGQEQALDQVLSGPLPGGETLRSLLLKTDLRLTLGVDLSAWEETPKEARPVDFILRIEGAKDLAALAVPLLEQKLGKARPYASRLGWQIPLPSALMQTSGLLLFDGEGTITLVSREAYLNFTDNARMKLGDWKEYQDAADHFPAAGNLLVYASPQMPVVAAWLAKREAARSKEKVAIALAETFTAKIEARPWSLCLAYETDGISLISETPLAIDSRLGSALPVLTGTSVLFTGARAWKKGADRAACIIQTRNVQQAVRHTQQNTNADPGDPIPWEKVWKILPKPVCPSGDPYVFAKSYPKLGGLACTCGHPEHEVPDHKDW